MLPEPAIHARSLLLAAVLRNLPIIHDQAVDDLANAGGPSVAASSSRERGLPTHSSPSTGPISWAVVAYDTHASVEARAHSHL